jgi:hypothetical protein
MTARTTADLVTAFTAAFTTDDIDTSGALSPPQPSRATRRTGRPRTSSD